MNWLDVGQPADLVPLDPVEEMARGPVIGHAGVLVADRRREKFEEALRGMVAGICDHPRHEGRAGAAATDRDANFGTSSFIAVSVT